MKRNARRSVEQWSELVQRFRDSETSEEVFCQRHGLALTTFRKWRYRIGAAQNTTQPPASDFVEVLPRGRSESEHVTVRVGEEISLEYPVSVGVETLSRLVLSLRHGR